MARLDYEFYFVYTLLSDKNDCRRCLHTIGLPNLEMVPEAYVLTYLYSNQIEILTHTHYSI